MLKESDAERHWSRWVMQTARNWDDISDVVKRTEINVIDDDHQKLTELTLSINNLLEASKDGQFDLAAIERQRQTLESLYAYSEHHFLREEELIEKLGLPDLERQRKQHGIFLDMLRKALEDFNHGRLTVSIHLKQWILEWWVRHINEMDYQTFCQENLVERVSSNPEVWPHLVAMVKPTGIDSIDAEHEKLIKVAIRWVNALQTGQESKAYFDELARCAQEHFHDEEELIVKHGLPGLEMQKSQHQKFMEILHSFEDKWATSPAEGIGTILNWWVSHINGTDGSSFAVEQLESAVFDNAADWEHIRDFILPTGVVRLDDQHRSIAEKMLQVEAAEDKSSLISSLDEMITLARHHFSEEEALMAREGSRVLRVHAEAHVGFLDMVQGYRDDLSHDRLEASKGLKRYLLTWWMRHIREFDIPAYGVTQTEEE